MYKADFWPIDTQNTRTFQSIVLCSMGCKMKWLNPRCSGQGFESLASDKFVTIMIMICVFVCDLYSNWMKILGSSYRIWASQTIKRWAYNSRMGFVHILCEAPQISMLKQQLVAMVLLTFEWRAINCNSFHSAWMNIFACRFYFLRTGKIRLANALKRTTTFCTSSSVHRPFGHFGSIWSEKTSLSVLVLASYAICSVVSTANR